MSKKSLLSSIEVTINETVKRLTQIEGEDKLSLKIEFKEWIDAIEDFDNDYEVLYLKKISQEI
tara:strand:- start:495 stop:683 length:189 start_codon:yes stop_codon:yes gene_type:complete